MTTKDNNIQNSDNENKYFNYLNHFLIIGSSAIGLFLDGYQTPDLFFAISILIWLWYQEILIIEKRVARRTSIKQLFIVFITASMVISIFLILRAFVEISQWFPNYELLLLLAICVMGIVSISYKPIIWLAVNNPINNIGKEYRNEGALK